MDANQEDDDMVVLVCFCKNHLVHSKERTNKTFKIVRVRFVFCFLLVLRIKLPFEWQNMSCVCKITSQLIQIHSNFVWGVVTSMKIYFNSLSPTTNNGNEAFAQQ